MKAVRRRLGIVAICIALVLVSVSLGTWVTKRRGELETVSWSPLFESREQRALTPLRTIEAMAQVKPTEQCQPTSDCQATKDCQPDSIDCEPEETKDCVETIWCDTIGSQETCDTTCSAADCETWDEEACDATQTCDEPDCETFCGSGCFHLDWWRPTVSVTCGCPVVLPTSDCIGTCDEADCETCAETCARTCEETCFYCPTSILALCPTLDGWTCEGGAAACGLPEDFSDPFEETFELTCGLVPGLQSCPTMDVTCEASDPDCSGIGGMSDVPEPRP